MNNLYNLEKYAVTQPNGTCILSRNEIFDLIDDGTVKKVMKNHNEYDIKLCQSFTLEDVWEFVDSVGDTNPIHQGNQPVVPGLLLMEYIKNKLPTSVKKLELSFRNAIFANEVFKLAIDGNNFKLWGKRDFVTGNFYE